MGRVPIALVSIAIARDLIFYKAITDLVLRWHDSLVYTLMVILYASFVDTRCGVHPEVPDDSISPI